MCHSMVSLLYRESVLPYVDFPPFRSWHDMKQEQEREPFHLNFTTLLLTYSRTRFRPRLVKCIRGFVCTIVWASFFLHELFQIIIFDQSQHIHQWDNSSRQDTKKQQSNHDGNSKHEHAYKHRGNADNALYQHQTDQLRTDRAGIPSARTK
jgi:uncharacterized protein YxeA